MVRFIFLISHAEGSISVYVSMLAHLFTFGHIIYCAWCACLGGFAQTRTPHFFFILISCGCALHFEYYDDFFLYYSLWGFIKFFNIFMYMRVFVMSMQKYIAKIFDKSACCACGKNAIILFYCRKMKKNGKCLFI